MKTFVQNTLASLHRFHNDEQGQDTISTVMLLAVAAMVVIVLITFGNDIIKWMKGIVGGVTGTQSMGG